MINKKSLDKSMYISVTKVNNKVVVMTRLLVDGIVLKEFQNQGIVKRMIKNIIDNVYNSLNKTKEI